jgi:hypothetical protein
MNSLDQNAKVDFLYFELMLRGFIAASNPVSLKSKGSSEKTDTPELKS